MLRIRTIIVALATALLVLGGVSAAFAAPLSWQSVAITLHSDQTGQLILVSGELPPTATLPASVELAVPADAEVRWIGEILGGAVSEDPSVKPTLVRRGTMDVYSFQLTKARKAQIELDVTGLVVRKGEAFEASLAWTPSQDVPLVAMSVRVPANAQVTTSSPGASLQPGPAGYSYYATEFEAVRAGTPLMLAFTYTAPGSGTVAPVTGSTSAASPADALVPLVLLAAFAAAVVLVGLGVRGKIRDKAAVREQTPDPSVGADSSKTGRATPIEAPVDRPSGMDARRKMRLVTAGLAAVLVLVVGVIGINASQPSVSGDVISKQFSAQEAEEYATIPLSLPDGMDASEAAAELFEILQTTEGMRTASVYRTDPRIEVGFCPSSTSGEAIRTALAGTGYVAEVGPSLPATDVAPPQ